MTALPAGSRANLSYDAFAIAKDGWPSGAMNCAIDAASAQQGGVRRVDDGLGCFLGDVGGTGEFERLAVAEDQASCVVGHCR